MESSVTTVDASINPERATAKVFGVIEIFLGIVLQLEDLRNVITCQRVCRKWKAAIDSSKALQRHLFFDADPKCPAWKINPVLERFMSTTLTRIHYEKPGDWQFVGRTDLWDGEAFPETDGSWKRMLVSKPPCMAIKIVMPNYDRFVYSSSNNDYVRLGDIEHGVLRMLQEASEHEEHHPPTCPWTSTMPFVINLQKYKREAKDDMEAWGKLPELFAEHFGWKSCLEGL